MLALSRFHTKELFSIFSANFSSKTSRARTMQKVIMLCGPPGVGKGTYARLLAKDFGYVQVSTGDEIRAILNNERQARLSLSTLSQLKKTMAAGKLLPDELVMEIIYHKIREPGSSRGVILDGFPRTINQLQMFTQVFPINLVITIEQEIEYLMASLLGRRTCMHCGMSYSAFSYYKNGYELDVQMPKRDGICDCCGGEVTTRSDDHEEVIHARLKEYESKTSPLIHSLQTRPDLVVPFIAKRGIRDYPRLQQIIISRLGLPYHYHRFYTREFGTAESYH